MGDEFQLRGGVEKPGAEVGSALARDGDDRIGKREHISANRWYFEIKLRSPEDIDASIVEWLRRGYEISG